MFTFGASASIEHIKIAFVIVFNSDFLVPSYQEGTSVYANYYWLGMKGETGTTIINGTVTLNIDRLSCVGDLCPADCVTKRDCESISGTFVS